MKRRNAVGSDARPWECAGELREKKGARRRRVEGGRGGIGGAGVGRGGGWGDSGSELNADGAQPWGPRGHAPRPVGRLPRQTGA